MALSFTRVALPKPWPSASAPGNRSRSRVTVAPRCVLKLYSNPRSRGKIVEWYLKELGVTAEIANLDMKEREHKSPEFLQVNPFGKVPALADDDVNVFESGAILLYLADKYGPANTPEARGRAASWALFANATLANAVFVEQFREKSMPDVMGTLERILSERDYLEGSFSVADVAVGAYLLYIPAFFPDMDLSAWPHVIAYMQRLAERPAALETVAASTAAKLKDMKGAVKAT